VLTVKTIAGNFDAIEAVVDDLHPYDVPPVIQIGIEAGKKTYLDWMADNAVGKH
jgi:periplasmic divalent cation tolerance protein